MSRTTRLQCEKAFERLVRAVGGEVYDGVYAAREGKFYLDYEPQYGGYRVVRFTENGESTPFGSGRYGASEFWYAVYMVTNAFEFAERLREEAASASPNTL